MFASAHAAAFQISWASGGMCAVKAPQTTSLNFEERGLEQAKNLAQVK